MGHHQYNGAGASTVVVNGHKYHPQHAQIKAQLAMQQHTMRPISSFYEYETINPHGNYRKIGDHYNQLQHNNKIVNGSSSVRIAGNASRGQIPDMKAQQQHRGPFITQLIWNDDSKWGWLKNDVFALKRDANEHFGVAVWKRHTQCLANGSEATLISPHNLRTVHRPKLTENFYVWTLWYFVKQANQKIRICSDRSFS